MFLRLLLQVSLSHTQLPPEHLDLPLIVDRDVLTGIFLELFHTAESLFKNVNLLLQILNLRPLGCNLRSLYLNGLLVLV